MRVKMAKLALRKPSSLMVLTSLLLASQAFSPEQALAQAMMEYGGLMAMPKGVPSGNTVNMLTNPYRAINNKMPGGNASASSNSTSEAPAATPTISPNTSPAVTVDALGTITVDPKKAQILGAKALKQYEQAKAKVAAKPADLKGAEALLREAINTRNSIWGYDDPIMPTMLTLMGEIYAKQKHVSESEACYKNALVYITKKQGSGSFERLDTLAKLGQLYNENGNAKDALPYFQQVAQIKERQFGAANLATLKAKLSWANVSSAVGKPDTDSIYKGLLDNLDQSDKTKAGYKELETEFVKSYGAYLAKEGKSEEANALASHFASAGAEQEVVKKADTDKSPASASASAATNSPGPASSTPETPVNKAATKVDEPQAKPDTQAKASDSSSSIGTMTMEQMLNAEASQKKKSKSKSND